MSKYNTRHWVRRLVDHGFELKRHSGGHAQWGRDSLLVTLPAGHKELSRGVINSIRKAIESAANLARVGQAALATP